MAEGESGVPPEDETDDDDPESASPTPRPPPGPPPAASAAVARTYPCKTQGCDDGPFQTSLELANHSKKAHPKPRKPKRARLEQRAAGEDSRPDPPKAMGDAPKGDDNPIDVEERSRLVAKVRAMMTRATKLGPASRMNFTEQLERLRVLATELNNTKSLTRDKFSKIEQAVLAELEPDLVEIEELDKDVPRHRQRRIAASGDGDIVDQMMEDRIHEMQRQAKIKELQQMLGMGGDSDKEKVEVFVGGMVLKVRPETALAIKMEQEKKEKEAKIEAEERERRRTTEMENNPWFRMQQERMQYERDEARRREEEGHRREEERRRQEREFREMMAQRDRENRDLMDRMMQMQGTLKEEVNKTRLEALEKELTEWKSVASQPSSERVKDFIEEYKAITGKEPNLRGTGIDVEEVRAKNETDALKTGLETMSTTVRQGFEMLNRRGEKHDRRMQKIEETWVEERKIERLKKGPRPPPMGEEEAEERAEEMMGGRRDVPREPEEEPEKPESPWGGLSKLADKNEEVQPLTRQRKAEEAAEAEAKAQEDAGSSGDRGEE